MKKILVTGGAGYIGSHTCKALHAKGFIPVTYDNLSRGHRAAVRWGPLIEGDIHDHSKLTHVMKTENIRAVLHFAAYAYIQESVENPQMYFKNNVEGSILLVEAMAQAGVKNLIFSSTCATYGESNQTTIDENHPQNPINPYGLSKLMVERILEKYKELGVLDFCALRYFNGAGADADLEIGETHDPEPHLIPRLIQKILDGEPVAINGNTYPTADGTCVRDFIHVSDLAQAHVLALEALLEQRNGWDFYNLGSHQGYSLLEIAAAIGDRLGISPVIEFHPPRLGDPARLVGDAQRFQKEFQWHPQHSDLKTIVDSATRWQRVLREH